MITVFLSLAVICFHGSTDCEPVLVGKNTPVGEFVLHERHTLSKGYGGTVIQFKETDTLAYSIHKVWTQIPSEKRLWRITEGSVKDRQNVSLGCINVMPNVYDRLMNLVQTNSEVTLNVIK